MRLASTSLIEHMTERGVSRAVTQRRLAQLGLGIVQALRNSIMTVQDAAQELFNLKTYRLARRRRYDPRFIEFIEWGMELEDIAELAPDGLEESYDNMERLLLQLLSSS
jgi:hypothetical protein